MFKKLTQGCVALVQKYMPDAFLFAILLTFIVFILGIIFNNETPMGMITHWGEGFWGLLAFSMQMALAVLLGTVLASAPLFKRIIKSLARIPKTPKQAIAFVAVVAAVATMAQWAFGLVFGAILAKEVAKQVRGVDYGLIIAASYSAFMFSILTSSIHLKAASNPDELLVVTSGVLDHVIPLTETSYHPCVLIALACFLVLFPLALAAMHPDKEHTVCINPELLVDDPEPPLLDKKGMTPAERVENSEVVTILVFIGAALYIVHYFMAGKSLAIDILNFILFALGFLLHRRPINYIKCIQESAGSCVSVLLQFPFYAGIMGMMTGVNPEGSTLAGVISMGIVSVATVYTFPLFTFISAALVNLFVPSAGGQWAVQAPVMFPAAQALGADYAITTTAITWGDTWTNMIQPFWAIPALSIAGLKARDIMGYCVMILLISGVVIVATLELWTYCFIQY